MIQIEKVEINYFRSVYSAEVDNLRELTVLSGKNDCGKSNILRALNLFFNNQTGWNESFNFSRDFCLKRLKECQSKTKSKQFIKITVHFARGDRYDKSLPTRFSVTKTWTRDSAIPSEKNSLGKHNLRAKNMSRASASLQRYLNTIRFLYVPAVKDRSFFNYSLGILQDTILQSRETSSVSEIINALNETVQNEANMLHSEFKQAAGVDINIHLPESLEELFRAFAISTGESDNIPLAVRGDGIQARFLPSLLHHVASNSKLFFIWGFEEPENCLEHGLATMLARDMQETYAKDSQILVTSHSPAFIGLTFPDASLFRVFLTDTTQVARLNSDGGDLHSDLGLIELQRKYQADFIAQMEELSAAKKILEKAHLEATSPILLVEGKTDVAILSEAWKRLRRGKQRPFRILTADADKGDRNAGCHIIAKALESCRLDLPKTIGLFDVDPEGLKAFKLDKNFRQPRNGLKISINNHAAAILIPVPIGKENYYEAKNLQIEFLFSEQALNKKIHLNGLKFRQMKAYIENARGEFPNAEIAGPHFRVIVDGKKYFALQIVPTLDDEEFKDFEPLLAMIETTFNILK